MKRAATARGLVHAKQPETTITGGAEDGVMRVQRANGAADEGGREVGGIRADEHDGASGGFIKAFIKAIGEVAAPL